MTIRHGALRVLLLGPTVVLAGDEPRTISGVVERSLLARLAVDADRALSGDRLIEDIWGDSPPARPRAALHTAVFRLRKSLGDRSDAIVTSGGGYTLHLEAGTSDVMCFEETVRDARAAARSGDLARGVELLTAAIDLWRGDALADLGDCPWVLPFGHKLEEARWEAITDRFEIELAEGQHARLVPELTTVVLAHPVRERLVGLQMLALYRSGRQAEALAAYDDLRVRLLEDIGVTPGPPLQELQVAILRQDPALHRSAGDPIRDWPGAESGTARPDGPQVSVPQPPAAAGIPNDLTSFVGRAEELDHVARLLDAHRLVTITGAGGCGKTRLALEAARRAPHPEVEVVRLGTLGDAEFVIATLAQALGVRLGSDDSGPDALVEVLRGREVLVVLDNCEHLLEACAELVVVLLESCAGVRFLTTSREPLGVPGERAWPLGPLALPGPESPADVVLASDAVRLFTERAAAAVGTARYTVAGGELVDIVDICRRLDGIALAIELATARLATMSVAQLSERLSERFDVLTAGYRTALPQHRTLRATMDWSHQLLTGSERCLFRRLAVFAGAFTLEAAEWVCGWGDLEAHAVLDLSARLAGKSLLVVERGPVTVRYRMLDTVREYAAAEMEAAGEAAELAARRHAWCVERSITVGTLARVGEQVALAERIEPEMDDFRAALEWGLAHDAEGRLAAQVWPYWDTSAHFAEGRRWLERTLDRPGMDASPALADLLLGLGALAHMEDDYRVASCHLARAEALFEARGDRLGQARCLWERAQGRMMTADYDRALAQVAQARELYRVLGDECGLAWSDLLAGLAHCHQGAVAEGEILMRRALETGRRVGSLSLTVYSHDWLGVAAARRGDLAAAREFLEEGLELSRALGDTNATSGAVGYLGVVARRSGDHVEAERLLEEALDMARRNRSRSGVGRLLLELGELALSAGDLRRAERLVSEALETRLSVQAVSATAQCLDALARIAAGDGDLKRAAVLRGAAEAAQRLGGVVPLSTLDVPWATAAADELGREDFDRLVAEGRGLPLDDAVALALPGR